MKWIQPRLASRLETCTRPVVLHKGYIIQILKMNHACCRNLVTKYFYEEERAGGNNILQDVKISQVIDNLESNKLVSVQFVREKDDEINVLNISPYSERIH